LFAGGEVGPEVEVEFASVILILIASNILENSIFGEMAVLLVII